MEDVPSGVSAPDPGPVVYTPLLSFTGGSLAISQPLSVSALLGPSGASLSLGPSVFTGPVTVGLEGFTGLPPASDPLGGLGLNANDRKPGASSRPTLRFRRDRADLVLLRADW